MVKQQTDDSWQGVTSSMPVANRVKVQIRCRKCGESFVLRGSRNYVGQIDTGFKRCLCDNEDEFDIETIPS